MHFGELKRHGVIYPKKGDETFAIAEVDVIRLMTKRLKI
jgi:hypothetical protein